MAEIVLKFCVSFLQATWTCSSGTRHVSSTRPVVTVISWFPVKRLAGLGKLLALRWSTGRSPAFHLEVWTGFGPPSFPITSLPFSLAMALRYRRTPSGPNASPCSCCVWSSPASWRRWITSGFWEPTNDATNIWNPPSRPRWVWRTWPACSYWSEQVNSL